MRAALIELGLEVDWDVGVQLQRRHLSLELLARAVGRDACEQLIGRSRRERAAGKRVHGIRDAVHQNRDRVRVIDQVGDIPLAEVQVEQELR